MLHIEFNSDLTLLVGINGSGKTSILNIINWVIKPSIAHLCVTVFKSIEMSFYFKDNIYTILCKQTKTSFKYSVKSSTETFNALNVRLKTDPTEITNDDTLKANLLHYYSALSPDQKEKKTWDLIATFPNPTIIGLDRNLFTEENSRIFLEETLHGKTLKKQAGTNISPLE